MKKNSYFRAFPTRNCSIFRLPLLLCCFVFCCYINIAWAHYKIIPPKDGKNPDSIAEKKADYLERIYFSGKNKEGLTTMILTTMQELEGKKATTSVAKQYAFLAKIREKTEAAKNACEVSELLAAGIYDLDAVDAVAQGIRKPGEKAKVNAGAALASLNGLTNNTNNLALSSWYLSGGNVNALGAAGKVAGAAGTVGNLAGTAGSAVQMFNAGKSVLGMFSKDKACKEVSPKEIAIGTHQLQDTIAKSIAKAPEQAPGTKITIRNIEYDQLASITSSIEKIAGVSSVNRDSFTNNSGTLVIEHNMKMTELIDKILQANKNVKLGVESQSGNNATLAKK